MSRLPEFYIAVDVEADGPIPGPYSMLSLGMAVAGRPELTFYTELKPISDDFVPKALAVSGLDRDRLIRDAPAPADAMRAAASWVDGLRPSGRPVFLAAPAVWDGMFVHWYFLRYLGHSPFGATGSGVDLRSWWMGRTGGDWSDTRKDKIKKALGLTALPHTHHAGDDAAELATIFNTAKTLLPVRDTTVPPTLREAGDPPGVPASAGPNATLPVTPTQPDPATTTSPDAATVPRPDPVVTARPGPPAESGPAGRSTAVAASDTFAEPDHGTRT